LGWAADDEFLIERILNWKKPPKKSINETNTFPVGLNKYVKGDKDGSNEEHISVLLYISLIGKFLTKHHSQNPKT